MGEFDSTRRNDPFYWAAAVVAAIQAGDVDRKRIACEQLRRLGYRIESARKPNSSRARDKGTRAGFRSAYTIAAFFKPASRIR